MQSFKVKKAATVKRAPLSYERIAILIVLSGEPTDRARIAEAVIADTIGEIVIKKSTVYHLVEDLTSKGYIRKQGPYYLSDKGWQTLQNELNRID